MALAESDDRPAEVCERLPYDPQQILRRLRAFGAKWSLRVCHEAGPIGDGLHRCLSRAGVDCQVVAPVLVPQVNGSRQKTDVTGGRARRRL